MTSHPVNVLLSSFPGLSLPSTLSFSLPSTSTVADLTIRIAAYLPPTVSLETLTLTTTNNKVLTASRDHIHTLLGTSPQNATEPPTNLLPLRLSAPVRGGKGGFGSQLRAAGGRMSSKRKRNQGEDNASSRNLDGRRLRTVNEAKALAEYLAVKPEMERKEKEERRRRWQAVVDAAEKRQEELKNGSGGGGGGGKQKVDSAWMEDREEVGEKARDAVVAAMKRGEWTDILRENGVLGGSSSSGSASASDGSGSATPTSEEEDEEDAPAPAEPAQKPAAPRKFVGFDDDDEFMSDSEDDDSYEGKGKAKKA